MSTSENIDASRFEKLKTRYFANFARHHFREMRVLKAGGELGKGNEDWRNISAHCLVEAVGADILAENLGADRKKVVRAALLHDWYKRGEVEMQKAEGIEGYWKAEKEDRKKLKDAGFTEEEITLIHSNILESIDPAYLAARTKEQDIIFVMDAMVLNTDWIGVMARQAQTRKNPRALVFCEAYRPRYGGKSLVDVMEEQGVLVERKFEKELELEPGGLVAFLTTKLKERIESQK